jgi:hypothetical protein
LNLPAQARAGQGPLDAQLSGNQTVYLFLPFLQGDPGCGQSQDQRRAYFLFLFSRPQTGLPPEAQLSLPPDLEALKNPLETG